MNKSDVVTEIFDEVFASKRFLKRGRGRYMQSLDRCAKLAFLRSNDAKKILSRAFVDVEVRDYLETMSD